MGSNNNNVLAKPVARSAVRSNRCNMSNVMNSDGRGMVVGGKVKTSPRYLYENKRVRKGVSQSFKESEQVKQQVRHISISLVAPQNKPKRAYKRPKTSKNYEILECVPKVPYETERSDKPHSEKNVKKLVTPSKLKFPNKRPKTDLSSGIKSKILKYAYLQPKIEKKSNLYSKYLSKKVKISENLRKMGLNRAKKPNPHMSERHQQPLITKPAKANRFKGNTRSFGAKVYKPSRKHYSNLSNLKRSGVSINSSKEVPLETDTSNPLYYSTSSSKNGHLVSLTHSNPPIIGKYKFRHG